MALGEILGAGLKLGAKLMDGRDNDKIENALTNAKNKTGRTDWSARDQKAYQMYRRMNAGSEPTKDKFQNLPVKEKKQYYDLVSQAPGRSNSGGGMQVADAFSGSTELAREKADKGPDIGNILGGLAKAFA